MDVEREYHFYAAHRNKNAGEKCGRIHGHTYRVKCTFTFPVNKSGITMLFADIDKQVEPIVRRFDHYFIIHRNDNLYGLLMEAGEPIFGVDFETSAENLARYFFELIEYTGLPITKIVLKETDSSTIVYRGGEYKILPDDLSF